MRGEIRRPELGRPIAGQGLALIAAGEEGELFRVGGADRRQPFDRGRNRLVPLDFAEYAGAPLADPLQGFAQLRRRLLLHDARGAFAADHAMIYRMIAVAFDIADAAIFQMDFDPAAAGAHVAGGVFDLVRYFRRGVDDFVRRKIAADALGQAHSAAVIRSAGQRLLLRPHVLAPLSDATRRAAAETTRTNGVVRPSRSRRGNTTRIMADCNTASWGRVSRRPGRYRGRSPRDLSTMTSSGDAGLRSCGIIIA